MFFLLPLFCIFFILIKKNTILCCLENKFGIKSGTKSWSLGHYPRKTKSKPFSRVHILAPEKFLPFLYPKVHECPHKVITSRALNYIYVKGYNWCTVVGPHFYIFDYYSTNHHTHITKSENTCMHMWCWRLVCKLGHYEFFCASARLFFIVFWAFDQVVYAKWFLACLRQ